MQAEFYKRKLLVIYKKTLKFQKPNTKIVNPWSTEKLNL